MNTVFLVVIVLVVFVGIALWFAALSWFLKEIRH